MPFQVEFKLTSTLVYIWASLSAINPPPTHIPVPQVRVSLGYKILYPNPYPRETNGKTCRFCKPVQFPTHNPIAGLEFHRLRQLRLARSKPKKPSYLAQPIRARHAISFKSPNKAESIDHCHTLHTINIFKIQIVKHIKRQLCHHSLAGDSGLTIIQNLQSMQQ